MQEIRIEYYVNKNKQSPFLQWIDSLDVRSKIVIIRYIDRLKNKSSVNNIKFLQDGVYELRIFFGPGYRIYFAYDEDKIILLLNGGDKGTQRFDIIKAKKYWSDYVQKK